MPITRAFIYNLVILIFIICQLSNSISGEIKNAGDARMKWWREARFGMFIHWGLYAIPAGEWNGEIRYGEWIRTSAQIPLDVYDKFIDQFNPEKFNAEEWVTIAKEAGMKYIVITSKHHDGFCLFDSKHTDFDVMSTPFKRDIMKELAEACRKEGIKICWYHSIMDWHHPDYLPRREWEKDCSSDNADFARYIQYMKNQLQELLTKYGEIGVLCSMENGNQPGIGTMDRIYINMCGDFSRILLLTTESVLADLGWKVSAKVTNLPVIFARPNSKSQPPVYRVWIGKPA